MSDRVTLRIRSIAAGLHAIFALPMGSFLLFITFVLVSEFNPENHNILGLIIMSFLFGLPMIIILPIILSIAWQITRRIHSFINLSGQDVLNYRLNSLIVIIYSGFAICTTCRIIDTDNSSTYTVFIASLIILNSLAISYFVNSVIGDIFALKGHRWQSRLIYLFIRDE